MKFQILAVCLALAVVQVMAQTPPIPPSRDCSVYHDQYNCDYKSYCKCDNNKCEYWFAPTPSPTVDCSLYKTQTACDLKDSCKWDDGKCESWLDDVAKGLATFVIIIIVICVLIVIGIIACIVCCCCMGANAMRNKDTVGVSQQGQQGAAYQNL